MDFKNSIRVIPDFPKKGIMFQDITTLLKDPQAFKQVIDLLYQHFKNKGIDYVAAVESRGYLFGSPLAYKLDCGLVIIRKPGKLPAEVVRIEYDLEYGKDVLEIHKDAVEPNKNVLIIDDLLATGGTVTAACQLIEKIGAKVSAAAFVIELDTLKGRNKLPAQTEVYSLLHIQD